MSSDDGENREEAGQPGVPSQNQPNGMSDVSWRLLLRGHPSEDEQEVFIQYWNALHEQFELKLVGVEAAPRQDVGASLDALLQGASEARPQAGQIRGDRVFVGCRWPGYVEAR
jgi:hypothetical protein